MYRFLSTYKTEAVQNFRHGFQYHPYELIPISNFNKQVIVNLNQDLNDSTIDRSARIFQGKNSERSRVLKYDQAKNKLTPDFINPSVKLDSNSRVIFSTHGGPNAFGKGEVKNISPKELAAITRRIVPEGGDPKYIIISGCQIEVCGEHGSENGHLPSDAYSSEYLEELHKVNIHPKYVEVYTREVSTDPVGDELFTFLDTENGKGFTDRPEDSVLIVRRREVEGQPVYEYEVKQQYLDARRTSFIEPYNLVEGEAVLSVSPTREYDSLFHHGRKALAEGNVLSSPDTNALVLAMSQGESEETGRIGVSQPFHRNVPSNSSDPKLHSAQLR